MKNSKNLDDYDKIGYRNGFYESYSMFSLFGSTNGIARYNCDFKQCEDQNWELPKSPTVLVFQCNCKRAAGFATTPADFVNCKMLIERGVLCQQDTTQTNFWK